MNIDAYYARQNQIQSQNVGYMPRDRQVTDLMSQPATTPYRYEDMFPQLGEADRQRLLNMVNNRFASGPSSSDQQQRMQQQASGYAYTQLPRPALGPIDRQLNQEINRIYYRHYMNGTYGSPEMFNELSSTLGSIQQQRESVPRPMPPEGYVPVTTQYMGLGSYGTPVVETSYQPAPVAPTPTPPASRSTIEARIRDLMAQQGIKGGKAIPTIGGPGGLPRPSTGGGLPLPRTTKPYELAYMK